MSIPEQPFGFVAGRWVLSLADTPMDSDRAPDYKPLYPGSVIFNNKLSHRVVGDGEGGAIGIVKTRYEAKLNEDGKLIDAEEHEFVALPVGVYSVTFSFGQYSWPNFDIEVKSEHTIDSPLWLPSKSPIPAGPGVVHVVSEEARLAAEAAAASAWEAVDTPGRIGPIGPVGPAGSIDNLPDAKNLNDYDSSGWRAFFGSQEILPNGVRFIVSELTSSARLEPTNIEVIPNHKYYARATITHPSASGGVNRSRYITMGSSAGGIMYTGTDNPVTISGIGTSVNTNPFRVYVDTRPNNIGDHVDVTDIVMIDLTEGFGVGNEPTAKQMDDWLEHTGWYTGPKPFVGDALYAQTLAGQGLGVRVDDSVGTRVLLDHPGGTTMLYGDTGWRTLRSWDSDGNITGDDITHNGIIPTPERAGSIRVRRIGSRVYWAIIGYTLTTRATIGSLPVGFRPVADSAIIPVVINDDGTPGWSRLTGWGFYLQADSYHAVGSHLAPSMLEYNARDSWPTTLPGEPA